MLILKSGISGAQRAGETFRLLCLGRLIGWKNDPGKKSHLIPCSYLLEGRSLIFSSLTIWDPFKNLMKGIDYLSRKYMFVCIHSMKYMWNIILNSKTPRIKSQPFSWVHPYIHLCLHITLLVVPYSSQPWNSLKPVWHKHRGLFFLPQVEIPNTVFHRSTLLHVDDIPDYH